MTLFCGIDWADDHHDIALIDDTGTVLLQRRIGDDTTGWALLLDAFAAHGDSADTPIPVAVETSHGLLVSCLRATGRPVFAINPLAVARYRDRHSVARKKSDAGDALVLAHILRTDMHAHRALPADSDQARAVTVLARAQQDAVWDRVIAHNRLRSLLHEYYPALLVAFASKRGGLMRPEARTLLTAAPTPSKAARLTHTQLVAILRRAGRTRLLQAEAARLQQVLRADYLHQPVTVEDAMGVHALALLVGAHVIPQACAHVIPQVVGPGDVLLGGLLPVVGDTPGSLVRAVAGSVHEDLVAGVDEPVEERLGDHRVGEQRIPVDRGPVAGQDH
jgi:transposase